MRTKGFDPNVKLGLELDGEPLSTQPIRARQTQDPSDDVRSLLATDPFPDHPPRYVRARFYRYRFTDLEEKRTTGHWWRRDSQREYLPAVSLEDP